MLAKFRRFTALSVWKEAVFVSQRLRTASLGLCWKAKKDEPAQVPGPVPDAASCCPNMWASQDFCTTPALWMVRKQERLSERQQRFCPAVGCWSWTSNRKMPCKLAPGNHRFRSDQSSWRFGRTPQAFRSPGGTWSCQPLCWWTCHLQTGWPRQSPTQQGHSPGHGKREQSEASQSLPCCSLLRGRGKQQDDRLLQALALWRLTIEFAKLDDGSDRCLTQVVQLEMHAVLVLSDQGHKDIPDLVGHNSSLWEGERIASPPHDGVSRQSDFGPVRSHSGTVFALDALGQAFVRRAPLFDSLGDWSHKLTEGGGSLIYQRAPLWVGRGALLVQVAWNDHHGLLVEVLADGPKIAIYHGGVLKELITAVIVLIRSNRASAGRSVLAKKGVCIVECQVWAVSQGTSLPATHSASALADVSRNGQSARHWNVMLQHWAWRRRSDLTPWKGRKYRLGFSRVHQAVRLAPIPSPPPAQLPAKALYIWRSTACVAMKRKRRSILFKTWGSSELNNLLFLSILPSFPNHPPQILPNSFFRDLLAEIPSNLRNCNL